MFRAHGWSVSTAWWVPFAPYVLRGCFGGSGICNGIPYPLLQRYGLKTLGRGQQLLRYSKKLYHPKQVVKHFV